MRPLRYVFELFPRIREGGLSDPEITYSRARFGANRLTPLPRESAWKKLLGKFDEPIIKILLAASLLKIVVDLFEASPLAGGLALVSVAALFLLTLIVNIRAWVPSALFGLAIVWVIVSAAVGKPSFEGLAVMIAVVLATGVAFFSEFRSDQEFEKLNAAKDSVRVKVLRGGSVQTISLEDVVVGELILLETGDEVPADGRIVKASALSVDQSLMTGESEPVLKAIGGEDDTADAPDAPGCAFRGTQVVEGVGEMVVTNVGDDTMLGQIARRLSGETEVEFGSISRQSSEAGEGNPATSAARVQQKLTVLKASTPLQEKLEALAGIISRIGYASAIAIFIVLLIRGVIVGEIRSLSLGSLRAVLSYFVYMVIIIVVAVPEGLPMSVTVSLAIAWRRMSQANALVRQLVACETVGSATVICTDKTGTLTQNKMTVSRVVLDGHAFEGNLVGAGMNRGGAPNPGSPLHWLILNAAVNSTATLEEKNGKLINIGNSTEGALLNWLRGGAWVSEGSFSHIDLRATYPVQYQVHFSSDRKRMTSVVHVDGRAVTLVKGAPEALLDRCDKFLAADGTVRDLTSDDRQTIHAHLAAASGDAMRTLAFAHAELPAGFPLEAESIQVLREEAAQLAKKSVTAIHDPLEQGLIFTGFAAIRDPVRDDVKEAIRQCREAGIEVKMITGDTVETARAIGREIGLLDSPDAIAMTSAEFNAFSLDELRAKVPHLRILARALPKDKYVLVGLLQERKEVVAMTGDGTNDAPALKRADVGLAMGVTGTEVAKEASKIVLLDDSFATIVRAVHWGRALYENIQRFVQFQLTINFSALAIAFLGPFLGLKPPFTVLQLLWINVIMDTFAAIALCSEPPRKNLMRKPPKRRDESILTQSMLSNIYATAGFFVAAMLGLLLGMHYGGWFAGDGPPSGEFAPLTVRQVTIFFTVYVLFQVWNQVNCRSLTPEESGLYRLFDNPQFLLIASLTVVGQVLIVTFGRAAFHVEPLKLGDWGAIVLATASVLVFAEVARRIRRYSLKNP